LVNTPPGLPDGHREHHQRECGGGDSNKIADTVSRVISAKLPDVTTL
jgi:hypothetical protein